MFVGKPEATRNARRKAEQLTFIFLMSDEKGASERRVPAAINDGRASAGLPVIKIGALRETSGVELSRFIMCTVYAYKASSVSVENSLPIR